MKKYSFKNRKGVRFVGEFVEWRPAVGKVIPRCARLRVPGVRGLLCVPVTKLRPVRTQPDDP